MNRYGQGYRKAFIVSLFANILLIITAAAVISMYNRSEAYLDRLRAETNQALADAEDMLREEQLRAEQLELLLLGVSGSDAYTAVSVTDVAAVQPIEQDAEAEPQTASNTKPKTAQVTAAPSTAATAPTGTPATQAATQYNPTGNSSDNEGSWSDGWD